MQVTEGSGRLLVLAVGERSEWGRTMALVASEPAPTPLQASLGVLAAAIGKVGLVVGALCFVVLLVRWAAHCHRSRAAYSPPTGQCVTRQTTLKRGGAVVAWESASSIPTAQRKA